MYQAQKGFGGAKDAQSLGTLFRLSQAVLKKQGDAAALPLQEDLADLAIDILGADHINTLTARSNLASSCFKLGRYEEALERFTAQRAVWLKSETHLMNALTIEHKFARSQIFLGDSHLTVKPLEIARQKAIEDVNIGPLHVCSIRIKYFLVAALIENDRVEDAIELAAEEVELLNKSGEKYESDAHDMRMLLQFAHLLQGNFEKAIEVFPKFEEPISYKQIVEMTHLAEALIEVQRSVEAKALIERALELTVEEDDGPYRVAQFKCMRANLNGLLAGIIANSNPTKAKTLCQEAISDLDQKYYILLPKTRVSRPLGLFRDLLEDLEEAKVD